MAYLKRKDCLQRNLYLNCVSLWKSLEGQWYRMVRLNKCSNLVECSLRSKRFHASSSRKLGRQQKKKKRKDGGGERREQSKLFRSGILGAFSRIVGFAGKRFLFSPPSSIFFTPALTFVLYLDWERSLRTLGLVCWFQWLEWSYCGLFFRMYNIDLKCSFVRCRKYHKLWWNGAAEFHISVDLLYGTTAAGTFERWTLWKIQQTEIDSTPLANSWNMYALRRFSKLSKDERFTKTE